MPFYSDTEQFYTCTRVLFARIGQDNSHSADGILKARLIIRMRTHDPEAEIMLDGRQPPLKSSFGPSTLRPELDIEMSADTLHLIMLGELPLGQALGRKLLKVKGPIFKTLPLADLFHQGQRYYPDILKEQGLIR
jgi:hypothetical protein